MNSLNEATSVVHDPESCSVIAAISASGRRPRTGPMIFSRYAAAAACGSISIAANPATPVIGVISWPTTCPNTCATFEAGSVETRSTLLPTRANATALAHANEVLPTPPLPVKKRKRGESARNAGDDGITQQHPGPAAVHAWSLTQHSVTPGVTGDRPRSR